MRGTLERIRADGFYKRNASIRTPQAPAIELAGGAAVVNFCANNYLGLADHPALVAAARDGARPLRLRHGVACASSAARRACTRSSRPRSPRSSAPTTRSSTPRCFDANGGLFETLLGEEDAVISDELNHASIIDGIRLCKAQRFRYRNNDMADLEAQLQRRKPRARASS